MSTATNLDPETGLPLDVLPAVQRLDQWRQTARNPQDREAAETLLGYIGLLRNLVVYAREVGQCEGGDEYEAEAGCLDVGGIVDVLRAHEWNHKTNSCSCGWSQKRCLPRRAARLNHPHHVAAQIEMWSHFGKSTR